MFNTRPWRDWAKSLPDDGRFERIKGLFLSGEEVPDTEALREEMEDALKHYAPDPDKLDSEAISEFMSFLGPGLAEETAQITGWE
jgi:hypothetical protein